MKHSTSVKLARALDRRKTLYPYGKWTLADGSEVLFNRYYAPMHKRSPDGAVSSWPQPWVNECKPGSPTWVAWTKQQWLYNDGTPEPDKLKAGKTALAAWGLSP